MDQYNIIKASLFLPYCVHVPSQWYAFPYGDIEVQIKFERLGREVIPGPFQFDTKVQAVLKDRFGQYEYSRVALVLHKNYFEYNPVTDQYKIKLLIIDSIKRFIKFFMLVHDHYWLLNITFRDIHQIDISCYNNEKNVLSTSSFGFEGDYNYITYLKKYFETTEGSRREMIEKLNRNFDIPVYTQLMLEAKQHLYDGSYSISILLFDMSFESFFDTLVKIYLLNNPDREQLWSKYVNMNLVGRTVRDSKLKDYSADLTKNNQPFEESVPEYDDWYSHCHDLRNKLAHRTISFVSEEYATLAFRATEKVFEHFDHVWYDLLIVHE